jgi:peptidyl-prolyl cis-trans isomerase D
MLQKLRAQSQSFAFKVLLGLIVVALSVFGFGALNLFAGGDPDLAEVDGESISQTMVAAQVEREKRRIAAQLGEQFDPGMIDPVRLQASVLEQMIRRTLLRHAADDLGMGASEERAATTIRGNQVFQVDGKYDPSRYDMVVQGLGYSRQDFFEETRELLALEQLQSGLASSVVYTERDLESNARLLGERRDLAYLPFPVARFASTVEVADEDIANRYEENRAQYVTPETVDVDLVELRVDDLVRDPSIEITEDALRQAYDTERQAAPAGEERRSRHILLELSDKRDAAAAKAEIEALRERIEAGESFADIATAVSEDPGSAKDGGDLGFAGQGVFDPAFEAALFALKEPGALSEPVETEFGYHLIQLEEVRAVEFPTFEALRTEVEQRLRREYAKQLFEERVDELDKLAFEQPDGLDGVSEAMGLTVRRVEGITRNNGPDAFAAEPLREAAFSPEVLEQGLNSAAVQPEPGHAFVIRVAERHPSEEIPLDDLRDELREQIVTERARELANEAASATRTRVEAGDPVADVALAQGVQWQRFEAAARGNEEIPPGILEVAFKLDRPAEGGKSVGIAELADGGTAVVTVTRVQDGNLASMSETEVAGLRRLVAERTTRLEIAGFYQTLEQEASISRVE